MADKTPPTPEPAPRAESAILPASELRTDRWKARKFRDNQAFGQGGDFDIVANAAGEIAAFVPDPSKLTVQNRKEIATALAYPKYARFTAAK